MENLNNQLPPEELERMKSEAIDLLELPEGHTYGENSVSAYFVKAYLKGARAEYLRHLNSKPSGLRWVKAEDRLPKESIDELFIKMDSGERLVSRFYDGKFHVYLERLDRCSPVVTKVDSWLDESTPALLEEKAEMSAPTVEPGKPHPEDVEEVERAIREILNKHLFCRSGGEVAEVGGKYFATEELAKWFTGFWSAMDEGAQQWESDCKDAQREVERLKASTVEPAAETEKNDKNKK